MSHPIAPGTPKAVKAAAFGRELVKACAARNVPLNELSRATGVSHSSLDNYRRGLILPKVEVGRVLAETLGWPRLAAMIVAARTFECGRAGCSRTFRNDTGAPRRYCSNDCQRIAEKVRAATRNARRAGQTDERRYRNASIATLRSGLRIADERNTLVVGAIDAMCRDCEPEGICQTDGCPLRPFSPLPLAVHRAGIARTGSAIRSASWTPARREGHVARLNERWADPAEREKARLNHPFTPEVRARAIAAVKARSPESFSAASRKAQATRHARAAEATA
ncbi:MAG: helix-turn-helix domain-containing protein [Candidatus Limnocylindrales bacterium]